MSKTDLNKDPSTLEDSNIWIPSQDSTSPLQFCGLEYGAKQEDGHRRTRPASSSGRSDSKHPDKPLLHCPATAFPNNAASKTTLSPISGGPEAESKLVAPVAVESVADELVANNHVADEHLADEHLADKRVAVECVEHNNFDESHPSLLCTLSLDTPPVPRFITYNSYIRCITTYQYNSGSPHITTCCHIWTPPCSSPWHPAPIDAPAPVYVSGPVYALFRVPDLGPAPRSFISTYSVIGSCPSANPLAPTSSHTNPTLKQEISLLDQHYSWPLLGSHWC